jgi:hypothetical protein
VSDDKKTRQQRRAEAREAAKLLVRGKTPGAFRWDYTLGLVGAAIGIILVLAPPKTRQETVLWLVAMFALLVYPAFHVVRASLQSRVKWLQTPVAMILLGGVVFGIGHHVWPPIRRHTLSVQERYSFEKPLSEQKEPREEIQILCAEGDEPSCLYGGQFVNLFREAGWKVQNNRIERVRLNNPSAGIVLFKHGTGKLDPDNWQSGLWTALTASLVDVRRAFVNIGIEPESASNPELREGVISIYFGLEREDEGAPTNLTSTMKKLGSEWRGGPIPPSK